MLRRCELAQEPAPYVVIREIGVSALGAKTYMADIAYVRGGGLAFGAAGSPEAASKQATDYLLANYRWSQAYGMWVGVSR
jgi:hypothetical protein